MGISGIGPGSLLLILGIVLLVFGTKRLRNIGTDAGSAIKGFKKAMNDESHAGADDAKLASHEADDDSVVENVSAPEKDK